MIKYLSKFKTVSEYIALELGEHPIDRSLKVYSNNDYLICIAYRQMYLFDRLTGKFIREISSVGRGPGEYSSVGYFDRETGHIIATNYDRNMVEYDMNGKMTRTILRPSSEDVSKIEGVRISNNVWMSRANIFLDKNTVAYHVSNATGDVKEHLVLADENGAVFKIFDNPNSFEGQQGTVYYPPPSIFYHYGGNTLFFEDGVDTIYRVTQGALIPHYHLGMGKYYMPYEKQAEPGINTERYFIFSNIGESDNFLFFEFTYKRSSDPSRFGSLFFGYYDKKSGRVKIADADRNGRQIINDIDNFPMIQLASWTIDEERNEMISYLEAWQILDWFAENPQKASELPDHLQKLSQLDPEDNPVVVVAKLK